MRRKSLIALAVVLAVLFGCANLQDRLLFIPQPDAAGGRYANVPGVQAVEIATTDGMHLRGFFVAPDAAAPHPLVIYFGGNAEEVSYQVAQARRYPGHALLAINYRGYGLSEGSPSEQSLFADALAIYDYAVARSDVDRGRVVAMGRSLGSGVAVYLASMRPVSGVILVTPYDSILKVAQRHHPYLPVSALLSYRFDSESRAPGIRAPLLMLTAGNDQVIPRPHSDALFAAWGGPKTRVDVEPADHNSLQAYPAFWNGIAEFLR